MTFYARLFIALCIINPTLCFGCLTEVKQELNVDTLTDWLQLSTSETVEDGVTFTISDDSAYCYTTLPCIHVTGIGVQGISDIYIERTLDVSMWQDITIHIDATTSSMDNTNERGFIETQCDTNPAVNNQMNPGATPITPYTGCFPIDVSTCNDLTIRIGGSLSGKADDIYITYLAIDYTPHPTLQPTIHPVTGPLLPSLHPTLQPTHTPTPNPTKNPTNKPSSNPTINPTITSSNPSENPSSNPTDNPSFSPSFVPSSSPTQPPSLSPTNDPTRSPTTAGATQQPSKAPLPTPTLSPTSNPSFSPSFIPSSSPAQPPSVSPTRSSSVPTTDPSKSPSITLSASPTAPNSVSPTRDPIVRASTNDPTKKPSIVPTQFPTKYPTVTPSLPANAMVTNAVTKESEFNDIIHKEVHPDLGSIVSNPMYMGVAILALVVCCFCVIGTVICCHKKRKARKAIELVNLFGTDAMSVHSAVQSASVANAMNNTPGDALAPAIESPRDTSTPADTLGDTAGQARSMPQSAEMITTVASPYVQNGAFMPLDTRAAAMSMSVGAMSMPIGMGNAPFVSVPMANMFGHINTGTMDNFGELADLPFEKRESAVAMDKEKQTSLGMEEETIGGFGNTPREPPPTSLDGNNTGHAATNSEELYGYECEEASEVTKGGPTQGGPTKGGTTQGRYLYR